VIGLVVLVVVAVAVFALAPVDGRFSQSTCLLLVAVLALIWHLALSDGGIRRTAPAPRPTDVGPEPSPVEASAAVSRPAAADDSQVDLSLLPDPPDDWPPPGVEVPLVFRAAEVEPDGGAVHETPDGAVARRALQPPGRTQVIDLTDRGHPVSPDAEQPPAPPTVGDDPWLAFAAAMFRDEPARG
jgi:hypothetical protein